MDAKEFNKCLRNAENSQQSFIKLYEEFYAKIVLHISIKFDSDIAHDIAQDFFCKIVKGEFKDIEKIKNPAAWIYRICDNMSLNIYKKEARYTSISDYDFTDNSEDLDKILDIKELLEILNDFERKVIYFHFFEGYSLKEISSIFNIRYDNFRKKYSAILKKLRKNSDLIPK